MTFNPNFTFTHSATWLSISHFFTGLYRSIIALGGTALNSQYFQRNPVESARELVSRLKCSYESFGELVECLRKEDMTTLVKETNNMLVRKKTVNRKVEYRPPVTFFHT